MSFLCHLRLLIRVGWILQISKKSTFWTKNQTFNKMFPNLKMLRKLFSTTPPFCICVCRLKHKSFMVCFFSSSQNGIVTVKVWWFWCFGNLEHEEEASTKIKNAFWTLVHIMMGEFLASGMCCVDDRSFEGCLVWKFFPSRNSAAFSATAWLFWSFRPVLSW